MAISFAEINRVTLRIVFLPWYRQMMQDFGITLPPDWNPSDEELSRLTSKLGQAVEEIYGEEY